MPHPVMRLLAAGIPISLLCDLVVPEGLDSPAINAVERPDDDPIWDEAAAALAERRRRQA